MEKYTTEELELELIKRYGEFKDDISKESKKGLFKELKQINGFMEYLEAEMQNEVMHHFSSTTDNQRWIIKGRFARLLEMKSSLQFVDKEKVDMKIGRYA